MIYKRTGLFWIRFYVECTILLMLFGIALFLIPIVIYLSIPTKPIAVIAVQFIIMLLCFAAVFVSVRGLLKEISSIEIEHGFVKLTPVKSEPVILQSIKGLQVYRGRYNIQHLNMVIAEDKRQVVQHIRWFENHGQLIKDLEEFSGTKIVEV